MQFRIQDLPEEFRKLFNTDVKCFPTNYRSPWFDEQEKKRTRRDLMCNIVGTPFGSADNVFDITILQGLEDRIREPILQGKLEFEFNDEECEVEIDEYSGDFTFKLYVKPDIAHNYVIGCDISWGMGSSNSAAEVYDVNTSELIAELVDPNLKPEHFADTVVALAKYIGGVDEPYLIWESNGGQANTFCDRILSHGYTNVYMQRREDSKTRKKTDKYGWRSFTDAKETLLSELSSALAESLEEQSDYDRVIVYSKDLCEELKDYVFSESGSEIVTSSTADLTTGARKRHGDRVIASALCLLGSRYQPKGKFENIRVAPYGSFEYYRKLNEEQNKIDNRYKKKYLF